MRLPFYPEGAQAGSGSVGNACVSRAGTQALPTLPLGLGAVDAIRERPYSAAALAMALKHTSRGVFTWFPFRAVCKAVVTRYVEDSDIWATRQSL